MFQQFDGSKRIAKFILLPGKMDLIVSKKELKNEFYLAQILEGYNAPIKFLTQQHNSLLCD